jgi:hypothetical protein
MLTFDACIAFDANIITEKNPKVFFSFEFWHARIIPPPPTQTITYLQRLARNSTTKYVND